ncbi:hypothetical protein GH733_017280 [Mirounga leonina]|nr:hypothetical protein GH733_017280 [Mirounga leonina]
MQNYKTAQNHISPREDREWLHFKTTPRLCLGQVVQAQHGESFPAAEPRSPGSLLWAQEGGGSGGPGRRSLFGSCSPPASTSLLGPLPKPSLQALPSSLAPLKTQVTVRCQGPPGVDLYRLEKLRSVNYQDQPILFIPAMEERFAGCYRCSYQNGSRWSPPSDRLELVATGTWWGLGLYPWPGGSRRARRAMAMTADPETPGAGIGVGSEALATFRRGAPKRSDPRVYANKPSLSAQPSPAVSPGGKVTLQCRSQYSFDQFALYKEGDAGPQKGSEKQNWADFPITAVTVAHGGTYRCYSFSSKLPYLWSAPSDPLQLVVTEFPEASRKLSISLINKSSTIEPSRSITISPKGPESPTGLAQQHYTKSNLVRICIGAVILILLVGLLAEDWHSRKKSLPHRFLRCPRSPTEVDKWCPNRDLKPPSRSDRPVIGTLQKPRTECFMEFQPHFLQVFTVLEAECACTMSEVSCKCRDTSVTWAMASFTSSSSWDS